MTTDSEWLAIGPYDSPILETAMSNEPEEPMMPLEEVITHLKRIQSRFGYDIQMLESHIASGGERPEWASRLENRQQDYADVTAALHHLEAGKRLDENLLEAYEAIACQNRCGCLHPACRNCERDKDLDEAKAALAPTPPQQA